MSEAQSPPPPASPRPPPRAALRRRRFSFVWLIPLVALGIAGYFGYRTILERGPLLTLRFSTAEGLADGQTQVKNKAVQLGTVEGIDLSPDNNSVIVRVRMNHVGERFLNSHARFWVVRPRLTPGDLSGFETLVSGAYIAVDPGMPGGTYQKDFVGLEEPPGVRSNEPGRTYLLMADNIGTLDTGSPVYYRDVQVGEVLGYDLGNGLGPVKVNVFVHAPWDDLVKPGTRFYDSSGIIAELQGGGFHIEFQSLSAVLTGAVTFELPQEAQGQPPAEGDSTFKLYGSEADAEAAGFQTNVKVVAYFESSVAGLAKGAPVDILGIQVGQVTDVKLLMDPRTGMAKVRVAMDLQPERVVGVNGPALREAVPEDVVRRMVAQGTRAELDTASFVTGQKIVSLTKVTGAARARVTMEGNALVVPSENGGLDATIANLSDITGKIDKMPLQQIGENVNRLLITTNHTVASTNVQQTLQALTKTLDTANETLGTVNEDYGTDSDFQRSLAQLLAEAQDTLRSVKQLTDYLNRNPQSLLLGRGP
jgi:paraquat-inducible protein B